MNTVTLSLEKYEELTNRIKELEKQVEEKTIIKEVSPKWWNVSSLVVFAICALALMYATLR